MKNVDKTNRSQQKQWFGNFMLPKRRFWKVGKHFRVRFRSTFQGCVAQIEFSHTWKVLRKRTLKCLSDLPKSSVGRGKFQWTPLNSACLLHNLFMGLPTQILAFLWSICLFYFFMPLSTEAWKCDCLARQWVSTGASDWIPMWETTFPRLTHAGLGRDLTTRHACSTAFYFR